MKSFGDCLKKHGLSEHENAILTAKHEQLLGEKYDPYRAAVMAVTAYRDDLVERRAAIYKEIGMEAPRERPITDEASAIEWLHDLMRPYVERGDPWTYIAKGQQGGMRDDVTYNTKTSGLVTITSGGKEYKIQLSKVWGGWQKEANLSETPTPEQIAANKQAKVAAKAAEKQAKADERKKAAKEARDAARGEGLTNNATLKKLFQTIGININERSDITGERGKGAKKTGAMVGTFKAGGESYDEWGRRLIEQKWILPESQSERGNENKYASKDVVYAFMRRVFDGEEIFKVDDMVNNIEAIAEDEIEQAEVSPEDVNALLDDLQDFPQEVVLYGFDLYVEAMAAGITDEAIVEDIAERAAVRADNGEDYAQAARAEIAKRADESRAAQNQPDDERQKEEAEPLELVGQTNAEILAAEEKAKAAAAAKAEEERAAAAKEAADKERGDFMLTGSSRSADVLAAQGQDDLLAAIPEPQKSVRELIIDNNAGDYRRGYDRVEATLADAPSPIRPAIQAVFDEAKNQSKSLIAGGYSLFRNPIGRNLAVLAAQIANGKRSIENVDAEFDKTGNKRTLTTPWGTFELARKNAYDKSWDIHYRLPAISKAQESAKPKTENKENWFATEEFKQADALWDEISFDAREPLLRSIGISPEDIPRYRIQTFGMLGGGIAKKIAPLLRGDTPKTPPPASAPRGLQTLKKGDRLVRTAGQAKGEQGTVEKVSGLGVFVNWDKYGVALMPYDSETARNVDLVRPAPNEKPGTAPMFSLGPVPVWRSALFDAISSKAPFPKTGILPVNQLEAWLDARSKDGTIKKDELEWSGLKDWLAGGVSIGGRVTKDQVLAFLSDNGVRVETLTLGERQFVKGLKLSNLVDGEHRIIDEAGNIIGRGIDIPSAVAMAISQSERVAQQWQKNGDTEKAENLFRQAEELTSWQESHAGYGLGTEAKYPQQQLPGGKNYREMLLTLPFKNKTDLREGLRITQLPNGNWQLLDRADEPVFYNEFSSKERLLDVMSGDPMLYRDVGNFVAGHYGQVATNVLAHVRFNERTDADGKRVLFVEEFQSDWAQKGRKLGFGEKARKELDRYIKAMREEAKTHYFDVADTEEEKQMALRMGEKLSQRDDVASLARVLGKLPEYRARLDAARSMSSIPEGPFVQKTEQWVALALKRIIRYAAENGFDRVAWTNGDQQANRYDLSQYINAVHWYENDGRLAVIHKGERLPTDRAYNVTKDRLADYIGKDAADKIVDAPIVGGARVLTGLDLKIGGEKMLAFYGDERGIQPDYTDKQGKVHTNELALVPAVANDVLRKLGGGRVVEIPGLVENGVNGQRYEGPTAPWLLQNVARTRSVPAQIRRQAQAVLNQIHYGTDFYTAMERDGSASLAEELGGKMVQNERVATVQQGFDITPKLRESAMGGIPMFAQPEGWSTAETGDTPFSAPGSKGLPADQVEAFAAALRKQWKNAPRVIVVSKASDLPFQAPSTARGAYLNGTVYLVADNLVSNDAIQFVLLHETMGHYGLKGILGDQRSPTMERIYRTNETIRKEADRRMAFYKSRGRELSIAEAVEEAMADMAATGKWSQISGWQMLFAQIRAGLRRLGFTLKMSNADVAILLANARRYVREGEQQQVAGQTQPALSVAQATSEAFKRWFGDSKIVDANGDQGTFDPNNPDIRFSLGQMFTMAEDGPVGAIKQELFDRFRFEGKSMSWLNESISTPYHIAQINKWFRPIYQGIQRFIADVSAFATEAADQAGEDILPQLRNWNDVVFNPFRFSNWAKIKQLRHDLREAGRVLWAGTLADMRPTEQQLRDGFEASIRDTHGNEIGTVKAPALTEAQIEYYRRIRRTIDLSLDQGIVSEMVKMTKEKGLTKKLGLASLDGAREFAKKDPARGADILLGALALRLEEIEDRKKAGSLTEDAANKLTESTQAIIDGIKEKQAEAERLKDEGYAPLMRFGQYTVTISENTAMPSGGIDKNVLYFGMFETKRDANRMAREMLAEFRTTNPQAEIKLGTMDTESWKVMRGLSLDTLEAFAKVTGIDESEAVQNYIRMAIASRSAMKRLIHRKGIAGYDEDVQRVLATFVTSQARFAARNYHFGELTSALDRMPSEEGETKGYAARLMEYVQFPNEEAQAVRGFLFVQFVGGSIASAITNLTQVPLALIPYLSQFEQTGGALGIVKSAGMASRVAANALAVMAKGTKDSILLRALEQAAKEGHTEPQEVHQLHAESIRSGLAGRSLTARKMLRVWSAAFSLAESFNRKTTFIAAYEMARAPGMMDSINQVRREQGREEFSGPYDFAVDAISQTQFIYNKANRPAISRGPAMATVMTFKQFAISYVEFLSRLPRREQVLALAILGLAAGAEGLPFSEDLMDLWDTIWQALGFNANAKKNMRAFFVKTVGETAGGFLMGGVSGIPGSPVDLSGRIGFGNLIPGTAIFKRSTTDATREVAQALGPIGSVLVSARQGLAAAEAGETKTAFYNVVPKAIRDAMQALDMAQSGFYRDLKGKRIIDTTAADAVIKSIGLMPYDVAHEGKDTQGIQQDIALHNVVESSIADRWARGVINKDPEAVQDAVKDLFAWNLRNPDLRIAIDPKQIRDRVSNAMMTREQRLMRTTPREIRAQEFAK